MRSFLCTRPSELVDLVGWDGLVISRGLSGGCGFGLDKSNGTHYHHAQQVSLATSASCSAETNHFSRTTIWWSSTEQEGSALDREREKADKRSSAE